MRIPDEQLQLFEQRLQAIGVGRRDFLRVVGAMAALGGLGFVTRAEGARATGPAPGEKLAKDQVFRFGGGGFYQNDPASHDFNKDLYCSGVPALFAGLMVFNADFVAEPWMASKVEGNKDGSVWTFTLRKDSHWSDNAPLSARDFEWSWKRQLDPASAAPYASFLYDIKNAEAFNKKQVTDSSQVGVKAKDDWTLEVTLEGPRGYFPVLAAYLAALPGYRPAVEKHGDKWTEAGNIVCNGPFTLESWEHNKQIVLKKNPYYFGAKDVHLNRVVIPIIPVASGSLPYENNELDLTALQAGDLKRLQSDPRMQKDVFRYPFPGTWYLIPQSTKPPFDNVKVRRAVGNAIDRDNVVKVSQGLAVPAWSMIPPGFPGATDEPKIKAIQKFDKKLALEHLKGTPYEGGKNWPKITLSMRDEALGAKPLAEAVQAVLLDNLNMKTELEVLEQRVFRERLWKQDLQFVWIRWFMDYPDPHNEYFDTFYGKKTTGKRQAWTNEAFDKELEAGRDTRDPKKRLEHYVKAEEILQTDAGYVPVAWVVRYAAAKPWVKGIEKNKAGEFVVDGNIYVDMLEHIYIVEKG
ncbi:MAG TPA: peptide ABC transporter substrate-binding protein [Candidatus Methylomirabilis sp.]|nr:peptide ABC transporter substrate-binding protein [Candidatus Methylomirabilis sp.]